MSPGSIALAQIQQSDGRLKPRPIVILQDMPPFFDWLACAVSSQLRHECLGFDEIVDSSEPDFKKTGLKVTSLIRLGLIATIPRSAILGELGVISSDRLDDLKARLAAQILKP